jgi:Flp pilus assembly protein TadG
MRNNLNLPSKGKKAPNFLKSPIFRDESGATAVFVAVSMFMLLTLVGLVIDLGHLYVVRQELQNAADAGADAGAMSLYWLGNGTEPEDAKDLLNCAYAHLKATEVVQQNRSDGQPLLISTADVQVGVWQYSAASNAWEFQSLPCDAANSYTLNAVRVTTRRSNAWNGPVNLWFAGFLGLDSVELTGQATALLGWVRNLRPGGGFPIAVGDTYVPPPGERLWVNFSPDQQDSGGWHSFLHPAASADYIQDLVTGDEASDPIKVGDFIEMQNGVATSTVQEVQRQFAARNGEWTVVLPVVPGANTYNQQCEVVGFVAFDIIDVSPAPDKRVSGWIRGGYIAPGTDTGSPSGGSSVALRASLPKLVQ